MSGRSQEEERILDEMRIKHEEWTREQKAIEEQIDEDRDCKYDCPCGDPLYYTKDNNLICKSCGEKITEEAFLNSDFYI